MSIQVTCPGCHARFNVSDNFAGREGPCPKCKTKIKIPDKAEEVVIHAPEDFGGGGRDAKGRPVLKPIERADVKLPPVVIFAIVGAVVMVLLLAWVLGRSGEPPSTLILGIGALALAPALIFGGYTFLRDDELEPYRGRQLWLRIGICSLVYALTWLGYSLAIGMLVSEGNSPAMMHLLLVAPPIIGVGMLAAYSTLDLEPMMAFLHYGLYLTVTVLLRLTMGMPPF